MKKYFKTFYEASLIIVFYFILRTNSLSLLEWLKKIFFRSYLLSIIAFSIAAIHAVILSSYSLLFALTNVKNFPSHL